MTPTYLRTVLKQLLPFLFADAVAASSVAQWELVTPIKTRCEFPAIQLVNDLVGRTLDLGTTATEA
jgi:hypothetical protein